MPQIECPDEFSALVLAFLGDTERGVVDATVEVSQDARLMAARRASTARS